MKNTKTKLISSVAVLLICFAMLIGSTFAWFTDSASTGVNKIQAGNLDVQLLDEYGNSLEGKTLKWKTADNRDQSEILWEPGASYNLESFKIKNNGNLNLKYKIVITGINGDAPLNSVIDWKMTKGDSVIAINGLEDNDFSLDPGLTSELITINGTMKTTAGNEYKGLSIDGISITVYATQDTGENDSFGPDYDDAQYVERTATIMDDNTGKTYTLETGKTYTVGNATVIVDPNGNITYDNTTENSGQTVSITTDGGTLTVNAPNDTVNHYGQSNIVNVTAVANSSFHEFGKVDVLSIKKGRVVAENGNNINVIQVKGEETIIAVPENVVLVTKLENDTNVLSFTIQKGNANDNKITVSIVGNNVENATVEVPKEFQNVIGNNKISPSKDYVARIDSEYYPSLDDAINTIQVGDQDGKTIYLLGSGKFELTNGICQNKNVKIIGSGYGTVLNILPNNETSYQNGGILAFENMTVQGQTEGNYGGLAHTEEVSYTNCKFLGKLTLYGDTEEFTNCTFENKNDYAIWTWGSKNVTFTGCTFNSGGKALLLYGGAGSSETPTTVLNVIDCVFNDDNTLNVEKAAIETGNDYGATYILNISNTTVNGFAVNPEGISTGTNLWANKNSMDTDHLNVVIDGTELVNADKLTTIMTPDSNGVINLEKNYLVTDDWTPLKFNTVTINGNNHTISGLTKPLVKTATNITIKDLTISNSFISPGIETDNGLGTAAFVSWLDAGTVAAEFNNCHLSNSSVTGEDHRGSGIVSYSSAGTLVIKNCTVENCEIIAVEGAGGLVGYSSATTTITNSSVKKTSVTATEDRLATKGEQDNTPVAGGVIGTVGGPTTFTNVTVTDVTVSNNNAQAVYSDKIGRIAGGSISNN